MIGAPASKSFKPTRAFSANRVSPLVWLNALCLDAPLVAISWHWLFARSFVAPVALGGVAALFLTAWLIYLADRFGDCVAIDRQRATSYRQRFCLKYRPAWIVAVFGVAAADLLVITTILDHDVIRFAVPIALLALAYLFLNQRRPGLWRVLPVKEITVGVLFAAGTLVPVAPHLSRSAIWPWLLFAALCSLNCISIAVSERWLDSAQQRVSIATAFPRVGATVLPALLLLAGLSFALIRSDAAGGPIYICVGTSAALLALTHLFRRRIHADVRTALADLVLLTPAVLLAMD